MEQHAQRKHAKWSMSGAHRWSVCLGQPDFAAQFPEPPPSPYALDGTKAHEVLDFCLQHGKPSASAATNDPGAVASVDVVLNYVAALHIQYSDLTIEHEQSVRFPQDVVPPEECGGHLDIFCFSAAAHRAWVIDFKHGAGEVVEVVNNKQLLGYATSRLWSVKFHTAVLVIIQPRAFHPRGPVREWEIGGAEIVDFAADIHDVLVEGSKPGAPLKAGPHCRWCPAVHACAVRDRLALDAMQQDFQEVQVLDVWQPPAPREIPIDKLLVIHRNAKQIKEWVEGVTSYLTTAAIHGQDVPGYKLAEAEARRHWGEDEAKIAREIAGLSGHVLPEDEIWPRRLKTITELTAKLTGLARERAPHGWKDKAAQEVRERLASLTVKESSGNYVLVPDTSDRPAVNPLEKQFAGVQMIPAPLAAIAPPVMTYGAVAAPPVDPQTLIHKD